MSESTVLKQAVRGALAVGAAGLFANAVTANAQTPAPASSTSGQGKKLSTITVTGSHIPRTSIATSQPVTVINRAQINATGLTTVGDLLQSLSSSGSALNVQFNNGGNGMQLINLHDLGSQRVLVLVNGQRWIPTLFGAVDLTTIPLSVVQRVEVLLDGASAIYGSEAIAGVINIITVKNYNGAEAHGYEGAYDGHGDGGGWDGKTQQYSFTVGTSTDRAAILLSAGYYQQQPVWAGQRTISKEPYIGTGLTYGSPFTPGGNFWFFGPTGTTSYPGCSGGACFTVGPLTGPDANPQPYDPAVNNYNYAPANYLRSPSERWDIFSQGHYDITDNVTFNFTTTYQRRNSVQALAPEVWFMGAYANGAQGANGIPLGISGTNPYNPIGVDLVPAYSSTSNYGAWCSLYGTGATPGTCSANADTLLLMGMQPTVAGSRYFSQNNQTFYFDGGFNGYWTMFDNQWSWDTHYIYGQTLRTSITAGQANTARMQTALGPLATCDNTAGCVPLDVFGGSNQITPAMLNYIQFTGHSVVQNVVRDYNANVAGSFWNSWYAGPWGVAAGYEYEAVNGFYSPDALIAAGNTVGNASQPTNGRENTNAQYAELNIPLASNLPLAQHLDIDLANRWSQFKWEGIGNIPQGGQIVTGPAGGAAHASTGRIALKWQPINQLLIRGSWSQSFRTPSISELFSGASDNYPNLNDPCVTTPLPPGCNGLQHTQPATQIHTTVGGFAGLYPEQAISRSVGFVYSPDWAEGLDLSADFYKVEIVGNVGRNGGQYYLDQCYIQQDANACSHIVTTASGTVVTNIFDLVQNAGSSKVLGWDVNATYKLPTTPVGDFTVHLTMNFMKEDVNCNSLGQCRNYAGSAMGGSFFGQPKHRYNGSLDWSYGPWGATWSMYLIGPMWESCGDSPLPVTGSVAGAWCSDPNKYVNGVQTGQNHLGTTVYNDVQGSYTVNAWNTTFSVGINNLFDKQPPISRTAFANSYLPVYYRTPGRFYYARVAVHF